AREFLRWQPLRSGCRGAPDERARPTQLSKAGAQAMPRARYACRDRRILHWWISCRGTYRDRRVFGCRRMRLRDLFERDKAEAAWRPNRDPAPLWCRQRRDGGGNGEGRAEAIGRRFSGIDHRYCRSGGRLETKAHWSRPLCGREPRRKDTEATTLVRENRTPPRA